MKNAKKQLALLLSLAMLITMVALTTTVSADPTTLLELDFSNFSATQAAPSATPNPSGVTATGSLAAGTGISFAERVAAASPDYNKLTKESFENANGGVTSYITFFDASIYPNYLNPANSWVAHTKNAYVTNADFESADNTISMWVDATACGYADSTPHGFWKDIFCYRVDYSDGGENGVDTFDLGINPDGTWNAISAPRQYTDNTTVVEEYPDGAFEVPIGMKHVVITNPKAVDGVKTMEVYVNGVFVKSVELDVAGTVSHATMHFFGNSCTNDEYWKSRLDIVPEAKLGGLRVYDGVLSTDEVASLYNTQIAEFSDVNSKEIIGYSFSGDTVTFDNECHSIEVTSVLGATEGVEIAYTCNGEPFTGAVEVGTYDITATITKDGYLPLVLNATLKIKKVTTYKEGDLLIDLDFSTYSKDEEVIDPDTIDGSVGFVTNNGALADSTVLKFKSSAMAGNWCGYNLDPGEFVNSKGTTTYFLHKTVTITDGCTDRNRFSAITESELEETANTITFWLNYVPQTRTGAQWNILDYYAVYGGTGKHLFTVEQAGTGPDECVLTGRGETPNFGGITSLIGTWVQIAVTNPEYELNSATGKLEKKMEIYVNGVKKGEKTVEKPEGALEDVKIGLLGEITSTAGKNWPQDASIGGFKVYYGALAESEIKSKYNKENPYFNDVPAVDVIEFVNGEGGKVDKLNDIESVNLKFTPADSDPAYCFAASYDENGKLIDIKCITEEGTIPVEVTADTYKIRGYAWNAGNAPLAMSIELTYLK